MDPQSRVAVVPRLTHEEMQQVVPGRRQLLGRFPGYFLSGSQGHEFVTDAHRRCAAMLELLYPGSLDVLPPVVVAQRSHLYLEAFLADLLLVEEYTRSFYNDRVGSVLQGAFQGRREGDPAEWSERQVQGFS